MRAVRLLSAVILVSSALACRRDATPAVISAEQVPNALQQGFATATGESKTLADAVGTALKEDNTVGAWTMLNQVKQRSDLTEQQHEVAAKAQRALIIKLQEAADRGDAQARQAVEAYRATK